MTSFEHYPPSVRKKIARAVTAGVALVLVLVFILIYTHKKPREETEPTSRLRNFYNTILTTGQSYLGSK